MAVHRRFPSNLMELERSCKEEWEKHPQIRCAKLVASCSKILEALIAAKGASTKYWARAVNTYVGLHVIFSFLILLHGCTGMGGLTASFCVTHFGCIFCCLLFHRYTRALLDSCCPSVTCLTSCSYDSSLWHLFWGFSQCMIHVWLLAMSRISRCYDQWPMHFCKALSWKSLWIKASAKWIHLNVNVIFY